MEFALYKIRKLYNQMGFAEKKVADYILNNTQKLFELSISELAQQCNCGAATIVRFSHRLGFDGYQALKLGILREIGDVSEIDREITFDDDVISVFRKKTAELYLTLKSTEAILNEEMLEKAATAIIQAERIVVFGLGNSAAIATDAAHKFLRLGLNAQACCDNHMQTIIASHLDRKSLAFGISHSGRSKDIVEALEFSKIGSATTMCITNYSDSPIVKVSDIALFTKSEETKYSVLALSSRLAQLTILDALYTYIVIHTDKFATNAIYNTEYSLKSKKIQP